MTDLLSNNDFRNVAAVIMNKVTPDKLCWNKWCGRETKEKLKYGCKRESLSALRGQNKELIGNFSVKLITQEVQQKLNTFWDFLMGVVSKQARNILP